VVKKKLWIWVEIFFYGVLWFSQASNLFHVGFKELFCERDGYIRVGENCIQFFHPLYIEIE